ncbi:hypothetical protein G9C98_005580 [Cotesia typhae]|uniref:DNA ligase (ATP) n=1 Tax=Cotesia typhae TaxID=2053667 RepID=A0A8J5QNP4_9HYME|nr:hypothetical protein G9C98_005580 [Cotesia typhae]
MDEQESEKPFAIETAKTGRAKCKKCKLPIDKDTVRIAKLMANPFGEGKMKAWHHVNCLFEVFAKQRVTTKRLEDPEEDIDGWDRLEEEDQKIVIEHLEEFDKNAPFKKKRSSSPQKNAPAKKRKSSPPPAAKATPEKRSPKNQDSIKKTTTENDKKSKNRDNTFREFRQVCANIANASAYTEKTAIVKKMFSDGAKGNGFKGDVVLWCKMLLPMANKKIYNLQSKALIKLFARILQEDEQEMLEDLEQGDVAETIQKFFDKNDVVKANTKSLLSLQEVEEFLSHLSDLTKEDDQMSHFKSILPKCTPNDLKMIIRLIKRDLRINCGPKHILEAVGSEAYKAYQVSNDLEAVVRRFVDKTGSKNSTESSSVKSKAEACTSVEMAMKKCPNGMLSEIKYDGERVQVHKRGTEFRYFSRSLKPVLPHKVNHFKEYIPKAFPDGDDLILDCEILMIDTKTGQPLPFGTLGVHKDPKDLAEMIAKVLKMGLEGLVLKDINSLYEPGKRHWLKIKKDYLLGGAMADSADLVVLGAWYGTGNKGGMKSIFLMGCYDEDRDKWLTVTKVHSGHDDDTLAKLQDQLEMVKIGKDPNMKQPVWEITGAEFTNQGVHTADSISIRFPRTSGCSSTGSSSKAGIKDSKSKKKYPEDAKERLSEECHSPISNGILKDTYIVLSNDFGNDRQKILSRSLITYPLFVKNTFSSLKTINLNSLSLGATVCKESSFNAKQATHIIHRKTEISEEELRRFKTVSARHVTESWVESTAATSVRQEEIKHAVNLRGSYCQCKCPHRKED